MWAQHPQLSLIPALVDSRHLRRGLPPLTLSLRLLELEKSGSDWFSGAFDRNLSLLTQVILKRKKDSELGIIDFHVRNPRNAKFGGPRGLVDHARGQALSGTLRASTLRCCGACMDPEEFSKVLLIEAWRAEASLCIT